MQQPVLCDGFAAPVLFDTKERPKGDGTEGTFLGLYESPSITRFGLESPHLAEK